MRDSLLEKVAQGGAGGLLSTLLKGKGKWTEGLGGALKEMAGRAAMQAGTGALVGGVANKIRGGNFGSGALSGAMGGFTGGSLGSSLVNDPKKQWLGDVIGGALGGGISGALVPPAIQAMGMEPGAAQGRFDKYSSRTKGASSTTPIELIAYLLTAMGVNAGVGALSAGKGRRLPGAILGTVGGALGSHVGSTIGLMGGRGGLAGGVLGGILGGAGAAHLGGRAIRKPEAANKPAEKITEELPVEKKAFGGDPSNVLPTPGLSNRDRVIGMLMRAGLLGGVGALSAGSGNRLMGGVAGVAGGTAGSLLGGLGGVALGGALGAGKGALDAGPQNRGAGAMIGGTSGARVGGRFGGLAGGMIGARRGGEYIKERAAAKKPTAAKGESAEKKETPKEKKAMANEALETLFNQVYLPAFLEKAAELNLNITTANELEQVLDTTARIKQAMINEKSSTFTEVARVAKGLAEIPQEKEAAEERPSHSQISQFLATNPQMLQALSAAQA